MARSYRNGGILVIYESALEVLRKVGRKACKKFDTFRHSLGPVNYANFTEHQLSRISSGDLLDLFVKLSLNKSVFQLAIFGISFTSNKRCLFSKFEAPVLIKTQCSC